MERNFIQIDNLKIEVVSLNTAVVGSGAAGFNAALQLKRHGQQDIAIVTEGINMGTSRNTGSDKQTYYKLTLSGDIPDSVFGMAKDLFGGKCMDGDIALTEAALSARCFYNLCELGVPFPTNKYGEYVGYKTDHDSRSRATSCGPLTSKLMTQALQKSCEELNIKIFDGYLVIAIITDNEKAVGLLALNLNMTEDPNRRFMLFNCKNIIYATGGPAGMYADSVYPMEHKGSNGVAFEAGVMGRNLTEWQYGLASVNPRWNVSGSYMQVLPRFISVDNDGNQYEFLGEYFKDIYQCLSTIFLKGYQWPFDSRKILNGSSIIDLLVFRENLRGRRVYLDFRSNPFGIKNIDFNKLSKEAAKYLLDTASLQSTPIERLLHMNSLAYDLFLSKGVDLAKDMLEIALCAQHNNGGLAVDVWWQTNIKGFFAAGEVAGTHGVYRPGGSALNSGQVGSLRAAQYISAKGKGKPLKLEIFKNLAEPKVKEYIKLIQDISGSENNVDKYYKWATGLMSQAGSAVRNKEKIQIALREIKELLKNFNTKISVALPDSLADAFRLKETLISQYVYLSAFLNYIDNGGKSRGSAIYYDKSGTLPEGLDEFFRFSEDTGEFDGLIQEVKFDSKDKTVEYTWRKVRPLPTPGGVFETVWKEYREKGIIE
ncbi:MAG TPA: FAD-binding protein [Clostridiales bacterium]|nr:FAD-binding protein [Clostridiales bacterium]